MAGSINLDCVAAAAANGTDEIHIISETYNQKFTIQLSDLKPSERMAGTIDLTKGMLRAFRKWDMRSAALTPILPATSSAPPRQLFASYEMLICSMINTFFNGGSMDVVAYAMWENTRKIITGTRPPDSDHGLRRRRHDHH